MSADSNNTTNHQNGNDWSDDPGILLSLDPAGVVIRAQSHPNTLYDVADFARKLLHYVKKAEQNTYNDDNAGNDGNSLNTDREAEHQRQQPITQEYSQSAGQPQDDQPQLQQRIAGSSMSRGIHSGRFSNPNESNVAPMPPQAAREREQHQAPGEVEQQQGDTPLQRSQQLEVPQPQQNMDIGGQLSMPHVHDSNVASMPTMISSDGGSDSPNTHFATTKGRQSHELKTEGEVIPSVPEWCTGNSSLDRSRLDYSLGHTKSVLNLHYKKLGLLVPFAAKGIVGKEGANVSHLALNQIYSDLPDYDNPTLRVLFRRAQKSKGHTGWSQAVHLDPGRKKRSPSPTTIPIFWAPKSLVAANCAYLYIGHFQCVRSYDIVHGDAVSHPGGLRSRKIPTQSVLEFQLQHFDSVLCEKLAHLDPNGKGGDDKRRTPTKKKRNSNRHSTPSKQKQKKPRQERTPSIASPTVVTSQSNHLRFD